MLDLFAIYRLAAPTLKSGTLRSSAFREEKTLYASVLSFHLCSQVLIETNRLLTPAQVEEKSRKFQMEVASALTDAELELVSTKNGRDVYRCILTFSHQKERRFSVSKLPLWVFILLGILGFDEAVTVLSNPILSALFV